MNNVGFYLDLSNFVDVIAFLLIALKIGLKMVVLIKEGVPLKTAVTRYLLGLGFAPQYKGFDYLVSAITVAVDRPQSLQNITNILYPAIAAEYGVSTYSVERCIRTAVDNAWQYGKEEQLLQIFGKRQKNRPSNALLIAVSAAYLRVGFDPSSSLETT